MCGTQTIALDFSYTELEQVAGFITYVAVVASAVVTTVKIISATASTRATKYRRFVLICFAGDLC